MSMLKVLLLFLLAAWVWVGVMALARFSSTFTDHHATVTSLCDSAGRRACP